MGHYKNYRRSGSKNRRIPASLQGILWSANVKKIDIERDKEYITHQVLTYGTLEHIQWLLDTYGKEKIRHIFLKNPSPLYTRPIFNLVKNFILGLKKRNVSEKRYVKTVF